MKEQIEIPTLSTNRNHSLTNRNDNSQELFKAAKTFLHFLNDQDSKPHSNKEENIVKAYLYAFTRIFSQIKRNESDKIKLEITKLISELLKCKYLPDNFNSITSDGIDWMSTSRLLIELLCLDTEDPEENLFCAMDLISSLDKFPSQIALKAYLDTQNSYGIFFKTIELYPERFIHLTLKATDSLVHKLSEVKEGILGRRTLLEMYFRKMIPLLSLLGLSDNEEKEEIFIKILTIRQPEYPPPLYSTENFVLAIQILLEVAKKKPDLLKAIFQHYNLKEPSKPNQRYIFTALPLLQELDKISFESMLQIFKLNQNWDPFYWTSSQEAFLPCLTQICSKNPKNLLDFLLVTSVIRQQDSLKLALPTLKILFQHSRDHFFEFLQHLNLDLSFNTLLPLIIEILDPVDVKRIFMTKSEDEQSLSETGTQLIQLKEIVHFHPRLAIKIMVEAIHCYKALPNKIYDLNRKFLETIFSFLESFNMEDLLKATKTFTEHGFNLENEMKKELLLYIDHSITLPNACGEQFKHPKNSFYFCADYYRLSLQDNTQLDRSKVYSAIVQELIKVSPFLIKYLALRNEIKSDLFELSLMMSPKQKLCLLPHLEDHEGARVLTSLSVEDLPIIIRVATPGQVYTYLQDKINGVISRRNEMKKQPIPFIINKNERMAALSKEKIYTETWIDAYTSENSDNLDDDSTNFASILENLKRRITDQYEKFINEIEHLEFEKSTVPERVLDPITCEHMTLPRFVLDAKARPMWWLDETTIQNFKSQNPFTKEKLNLIYKRESEEKIGYAPINIELNTKKLDKLEKLYQRHKNACDAYMEIEKDTTEPPEDT